MVRSPPGLGRILGARVFRDDPSCFTTAKCYKNYAGMSPTPAPRGQSFSPAMCTINACRSDLLLGYRGLYRVIGGDYGHASRRGGHLPRVASSAGNRRVGILRGCLTDGSLYDEQTGLESALTEAAGQIAAVGMSNRIESPQPRSNSGEAVEQKRRRKLDVRNPSGSIMQTEMIRTRGPIVLGGPRAE